VRTVENPSPATIQQSVRPGDTVRVGVRDGRVFELAVEQVEADALTGATVAGKRYRIPYATVKTIEVGDVSSGTTVATVAIVAGAIAIVAIIFEGFEDFGEAFADAITGGDD
jgi:hypothetical protein